MSNKITKFISRIAGAVSKNEQTREFLTPATSEISRDTKNLLAGLFGKNDQKGENNQDNSKSDIKANHGIINVTHNNLSFVNNKLNPQAEKANSKPKVISFKSVTPLNNGPMDIEAADTVPKSEDISAILNTCESDNLIKSNLMQDNNTASDNNVSTSGVRDAQQCPYCQSKNFVKRGVRKNVNQTVQLYLCKNGECLKTFTASDVKGKHFPLHIIIESMSYYNLGLTLEDTCKVIKSKFGVAPESATLSDWINEYKSLCRYERLRPYAIKMFGPKEVIEVTTMAHRQLYRFRYHRAKTILMLEEFKNRVLSPLKSYLDNVSSETPHQYFSEGERMSEIRSKFDKADMIVKGKFNYANKLAAFVLQAVKDNKQRHEELQRFMIANDSCTVATEVPVYIRREDVAHMENVLKFKIAGEDGKIEIKGGKKIDIPKLLTGHIDIVQVRNGQVHLLDYKPNAEKERPIEQLTWYAMAMSRLTGLRMFEFKCAWFDEKDYFEFYPLHVVKKLQGKKKRRIFYRSGEMVELSKEDELKIVPKVSP